MRSLKDAKTGLYMNKPVFLNGHVYDFETLKGTTQDPLSNQYFRLKEITPATTLYKEAEVFIKTINTRREASLRL